MIIEGFWAGSVPRTNGSGSRRHKSIRILRIRIRKTTIENTLSDLFTPNSDLQISHSTYMYPLTTMKDFKATGEASKENIQLLSFLLSWIRIRPTINNAGQGPKHWILPTWEAGGGRKERAIADVPAEALAEVPAVALAVVPAVVPAEVPADETLIETT